MKNKGKIFITLLLSLSLICSQMMPIMAEEGDYSESESSEEVVLDLASDDEQDHIDGEEPEKIEEETVLSADEEKEDAVEEKEQVDIEEPEISNEAVSVEQEDTAVQTEIPESLTESVTAVSDKIENNIEKNTEKTPVTTYKLPRVMSLAAMQPKAVTSAVADGTYAPDDFTVTGGTGRVKITCPSVMVFGDKAWAKIVFSSNSFTKVESAGKEYTGTICDSPASSTFYIPADINKEYTIIGTTVAMTEPKAIEYKITIRVSSNSKKTTDSGFDQFTESEDPNLIKDGIYEPDNKDNIYAGEKKPKVTISCSSVRVEGDKAWATIAFSSESYTILKVGDEVFNQVLDTVNKKSIFENVPVEINKDIKLYGTTVAMTEPHEIEYVINIALTPTSKRLDSPDENDPDTPTDPTKPGDPSKPTDPTKPSKPTNPTQPTKPAIPSTPEKLADGTYKLKADTDNRMFYLVPKDEPDAYRATLVKKDGKYTVTITLSGTGYDYLFVGTAKKAEQTPKKEWIKYKESNGYYSYTFDISALDKEIKIASHSESHNQWYEHTIIFYSDSAKLVKAGTTTVPKKPKKDKDTGKKDKNNKNDKDNTNGTQTEFKNDHKKDKESESKGDTEKSTYAVDSSTGLADGVYTPDKFSWSGGTGRLAYIRCDKITVTDGQAYATIVFSSPSYDQLKANGRVYYNSGSEFSTFVIPVQLNSNNTIVGRTTAMSAPHWIEYSIFIYSNAAAKANGEKEISGDSIKTSKLSEEAPEIAGLETKEETEVHYAENFKIFNYEDGVALIQMDLTNNSGLKYKKEDKNAEDKVEYDDDGKPIAKSQGEITEEMYHANVVNYLIVPKGVEVPAGLDKECIIIQAPLKRAQVSSEGAMEILSQLGAAKYIKATGLESKDIKIDSIQERFEKEKTFYAGDFAKPDYKEIIRNKIDINILPAEAVPVTVKKKDEKGNKLSDEKIKEQKDANKKQQETLELIEKRYSTLGIPVIIDRSASEKDELAKAEWILIYGTLFGCEEEAQKLFDEYEKKYKEENHE